MAHPSDLTLETSHSIFPAGPAPSPAGELGSFCTIPSVSRLWPSENWVRFAHLASGARLRRGPDWVRFARFTPRLSHAPHDNRLFPFAPVPLSLASFRTISSVSPLRPGEIGFVSHDSTPNWVRSARTPSRPASFNPQSAIANPQSQAPGPPGIGFVLHALPSGVYRFLAANGIAGRARPAPRCARHTHTPMAPKRQTPGPQGWQRRELALFCTTRQPGVSVLRPAAGPITEAGVFPRVRSTPTRRWHQSAKLPPRRGGIFVPADS
jgi:hypothetical protein